MKNPLHRVAAAFLFSAALSAPAFAQWQQVGGLFGEPVYSVRATGTRLFALTQTGVYRSDNNGSSWAQIPQLFLANVVERLAVSGDTITVYANPESYISIDNGDTWNELTAPAGVFSSDVASGGGKAYMSTYGDYFYTSDNSGATWTQVTQGLTTPEINCISTEGSTVYVGTDDGIFKSTNSGTSFSFSGLSGEYVNKVYVKSPNVFAYTATGIYKSGDNGATWAAFQPAIGFADILDFAVSGNRVFASTNGELISSIIFAPSWQVVNMPAATQFSFSVCNQGTELFLGSNRGVAVTSNNGSSWTEINNGIIPSTILSLTVTDTDTLYAGASVYGVSNYSGGFSWNFSGLAMLNSTSMTTDANGAVYSTSEFGINRSTDGGLTWQLINNTPLNPVIAYCADVAINGNLIVGGALQSGVLRSDDYGASWALIGTGLAGAQVGQLTFSGSNIIAGTYNNGLYTSTDGGLTWSQTAGAGEIINDVVALGNKVFAACPSPGGNFISDDGGLTWTQVANGYFDKLAVNDSLIIGSGFTYIEVSRDSGMTFADNTPAPPQVFFLGLHATPTDIYAGSAYDGVWKISISAATGIEESQADLSAGITLYPTVCRDETALHVEESVLGSAPSIQVFDLKGQLLKTEKVTTATTRIDLRNFDKGLYLYRVTGNGVLKTGKIILQ